MPAKLVHSSAGPEPITKEPGISGFPASPFSRAEEKAFNATAKAVHKTIRGWERHVAVIRRSGNADEIIGLITQVRKERIRLFKNKEENLTQAIFERLLRYAIDAFTYIETLTGSRAIYILSLYRSEEARLGWPANQPFMEQDLKTIARALWNLATHPTQDFNDAVRHLVKDPIYGEMFVRIAHIAQNYSDAPKPVENSDAAFLPLPAVAPETFAARGDRAEPADQFLKRVWGPWLQGNGLYRHLLKGLDESLLIALKNQFKGRTDELRAWLPTKSDQVTRRVNQFAGENVTDAARRRAIASAERRLHAAKALNPK